jgi:hypothetical protein
LVLLHGMKGKRLKKKVVVQKGRSCFESYGMIVTQTGLW